jgi:hypothetical protein
MASESGRALPAAGTTAASLPHSIVLKVLACLPADARARFATVCRAWRDSLAERSFWTHVDLSRSGGATCTVDDAALEAVEARAGGRLEALVVSEGQQVTLRAVLRLLTANAGALRELRLSGANYSRISFDFGCVEAMVRAAPQLELLEVDVLCGAEHARRLLRNEPPLGVVRVVCLVLDAGDAATLLALAADVPAHVSLRCLGLSGIPLDALGVLDAVVDAALAHRLEQVIFLNSDLSPASAPALARLLGGCDCTSLYILGSAAPGLLDGPAAARLSIALRKNSVLTHFTLRDANLWQDAAGASLLLGALIAHPSVQSLDVGCNDVSEANKAAAGCALAALIAADAAALEELDVSHSSLGDAGMGHAIDALSSNTHLRTLKCTDNDMTDEFVRARLLPMVRTNTTLSTIQLVEEDGDADAPLCLQLAQELFETRVANRQ